MPTRYVIANWKLNLPPEGLDQYLAALGNADTTKANLCVAPPFVYIERAAAKVPKHVAVGAQNVADRANGAFTGEVSATMLKDAGATFAIIGHSERRNVYGETDAMVAMRLAMCIEGGLTPVLCIGEDLATREEGRAAAHLANQIRAVVTEQLQKAGEIVVAYEPVWAIGTGRNATGLMCAETVKHIREAIARHWVRENIPILYGGSVTPENVDELVGEGAIDGFLVGGASLDSKKFLRIHGAMGGR
jgi:triosephosphate isomerase